MQTPKIFGREPAFVAGMVEAVLAVLVSFGMLSFVGIDGAQGLAVVMSVTTGGIGLYVAYVTKDTLLGVGLAFTKSVIALLAYYKYDMSETQMTTLIALLSLTLGGFQRTQTGPAVIPSFDLGQHTVETPLEGEATSTTPAIVNNTVVERPVDPGELPPPEPTPPSTS